MICTAYMYCMYYLNVLCVCTVIIHCMCVCTVCMYFVYVLCVQSELCVPHVCMLFKLHTYMCVYCVFVVNAVYVHVYIIMYTYP